MNTEMKVLAQDAPLSERLPYHTPVLKEFGEMRTLTLSPTFDDDDESGPSTYTYNAAAPRSGYEFDKDAATG